MMPKAGAAGAEKVASPWQLRQVYGSIFLSITTSCAALQAEPLMMTALCGGDVGRAAILLSGTSSVSNIISLVVNQIGGRLSDAVGRKLLFLVGPGFSAAQGLLIFANQGSASPSLALLVVCRTLRLCLGTFSSSVMCMASLSDLAQGKQLSVANSVLWACAGLGVILGPILEGAVLSRGFAIRCSYLLAAVVSAVQVAYQLALVDESHPKAERRPFSIAGLNPLGFLKLFNPGTPTALKKLVLVASLQSFLEGKNVVDMVQIWQRQHLKWDVLKMRDFTVTYGCCAFVAGQLLTPFLLKISSARAFTTFANLTNATGFIMRGWAENPLIFWLAIIPMLPGVNGSSASAMKAIASDHALAAGFGAGEYSGYFNNLRALVGAAASLMYGATYSVCIRRGLHPGIPFWVGGLMGAVLPELIHRTLSTREIREHSKID